MTADFCGGLGLSRQGFQTLPEILVAGAPVGRQTERGGLDACGGELIGHIGRAVLRDQVGHFARIELHALKTADLCGLNGFG